MNESPHEVRLDAGSKKHSLQMASYEILTSSPGCAAKLETELGSSFYFPPPSAKFSSERMDVLADGA